MRDGCLSDLRPGAYFRTSKTAAYNRKKCVKISNFSRNKQLFFWHYFGCGENYSAIIQLFAIFFYEKCVYFKDIS